MKLLYAEDETGMSEAVVDILTYHNYSVDAVYNGAEALAYAETEPYDCIILDIMMPEMSGLTFRHGGIARPSPRHAPAQAGCLYPGFLIFRGYHIESEKL